jgi:hypothetical protein
MTALNLTQDAQSLPYGPLVVGMPVIANHCEQPCAQLVAIIGRIHRDGLATLHYLSTYPDIRKFKHGLASITPLSCFSIGIEVDEADGTFRCVPMEGVEPTAHYKDGRLRRWQPWGTPSKEYRPEVLKMLDRRFVI